MKTRNTMRTILGAATLTVAAATIFTAQTPAPPPGQIAIPQPCTPEQIAAMDAAAAGQPAAAPAGGGRGGRGAHATDLIRAKVSNPVSMMPAWRRKE